jgi:hypothetical protein
MENHDFPIYRKAAGGRSYYKILSLTEVLELQIIGTRYTWHHLLANIYPEKVFIGDLIDCTNNSFIRIMEEEYSEFIEHCKSSLEEWNQK